MSYSIKVPVIEIPSSLPASNVKFGYHHSNISSQASSTTIPSLLTTPNDAGSPHNYNICSPSYGATPTSCSYTINPFNQYAPNGLNNNKHEIICNTPNTINNATHYNGHNKRKSRHKRAHPRPNTNNNNNNNNNNQDKPSLIQQSITPLTPTPNMDIAEVTFDFETIDIMENADITMADGDENDEKMNTFDQHLTTKHLNALSETDDNVSDNNTDIDVEMSTSPKSPASNKKNENMNVTNIENRQQEIEDDNDDKDNKDRSNVDEDNQFESSLLQEMGYMKSRKITNTLQGCVFIALNEKNMEMNNGENSTVVIKRTSKYLHKEGITIQDGKVYAVNENVLKEYDVLKHFTNSPNCPSQITKVLDFFESDNNYYLGMSIYPYFFI